MNLSDLEAKIPSWAKWLALGLLLLAIFGSPFNSNSERKQCKRLCLEQDFASFRYKPYFNDKTGPKPSSCHCLTAEEAHDKSRVYPGVKQF